MSVENLLIMMGIVAEAAFIAVFVWRRTYRSLPVFFCYIVWGLAGDCTVLFLRSQMPSHSLFSYEVETYIDSLFQYLVLIELAWSILRPIQSLLPKGFLPGISLTIISSAVLAWPLTGMNEMSGFPPQLLIALHAQRTFAILRVLFFLALVCCSQFLRIGWRDRELQAATGLGFYSLVSLAGTLVHSHQIHGLQYYYVDLAVASSYLLSLVYWIYSFAQPETARREMTPEMQDLLLRMANVTRQQRAG